MRICVCSLPDSDFIASGRAVGIATAQPGSWSLGFPTPRVQPSAEVPQGTNSESRSPASAVTRSWGPLGDSTVALPLTDIGSVFFALPTVDGRAGSRSPAAVAVDRGAVAVHGIGMPRGAVRASCLSGRRVAIANLAPAVLGAFPQAA